jgi:hypothetical protein
MEGSILEPEPDAALKKYEYKYYLSKYDSGLPIAALRLRKDKSVLSQTEFQHYFMRMRPSSATAFCIRKEASGPTYPETLGRNTDPNSRITHLEAHTTEPFPLAPCSKIRNPNCGPRTSNMYLILLRSISHHSISCHSGTGAF